MPIHDKTPRPQEFAAVDLGSNSFHMVIARVVDGAMQIIGRLKQRVHLADGLGEDNKLSEEAMERGLSCLSLFAERLQGFPDNHTQIPYRNKPADQCPDGPRYAACGNSMAVPVMRWIGQRIQDHIDGKL